MSIKKIREISRESGREAQKTAERAREIEQEREQLTRLDESLRKLERISHRVR